MRYERMKLLSWLCEQIDSGKYEGLRWLNSRKTIFRIDWKHGSRQGYSPDHDASVFKAWAAYTGKLQRKGTAKTWKANFRCALNSLKEIRHKNRLGEMRGPKAFRVFEILSKENIGYTEDDSSCDYMPISSDEETSSSDSELFDYDVRGVDECDLNEVGYYTTVAYRTTIKNSVQIKREQINSQHCYQAGIGNELGDCNSIITSSVVPTPPVLQNNDLSKDELLKLVNDIIIKTPIKVESRSQTKGIKGRSMIDPIQPTNNDGPHMSNWIIKDDPYLPATANNNQPAFNQPNIDPFMNQLEMIIGC